MKLGTRKGTQGHPPPWFEKQCQVMHADLHYMRHPRADSDPTPIHTRLTRVGVSTALKEGDGTDSTRQAGNQREHANTGCGTVLH